MKAKNFFLVLGSIVTVFCCTSCNKENTPVPVENKNNESSIAIDLAAANIEDAANPANPYDDFGKAHFDGIVYVVKDLNGSLTAPISSIYKSAVKFEKTLHSAALRSSSTPPFTEEELVDVYKEVKQNFTFKVLESASPKLKEEMTRLSEVFRQLEGEDENCNYQTIKQRLVAYEASILEDSQLNSEEKTIILKMTSTARYSALQWELPLTKLMEQKSTSAVKSVKAKIKKRWYHWLLITAADAGGAIAGATVGPSTSVGLAVSTSSAVYTMIDKELQ